MPKPVGKRRLLFALVVFLVGMLVTFIPQTHALALTYPAPSWWSGDTCDSTHFNASGQTAHLLTTWNGIQVCGYGPTQGGTDVTVQFTTGGSTENEWECTELVKRYLYIVYGALSLSNTNGSQIVDNYSSTYSSQFTKLLNNGTNHVKVGDVLSYGSPDNHTAIVKSLSLDGSGTGTITVIEENASTTGQHTQTVTNWVIKKGVDDGGTTDTVAAWLTPKETWTDNSPSGGTHDAIFAMAASSTSNIWAAGHEIGTNSRVPVTYQNTGSGWTKYSPTHVGGQYDHNELNGVATSSSSDAWAVGQADSGPTQTLAYHWNGTSWSHITSDDVGTNHNYLEGVAYAGTDVFAVGYYLDSSDSNRNKPLVEKYVTSPSTKLASQTINLPTGETSAVLYSISCSSSTNCWAVGQSEHVTGGVGVYNYVIYQYNGTSWTSTLGSISSGSLISVVAVSGSEAWAVGSQGVSGTPLILHTTNSGSTWTEDTSFNGNYPSGAQFYSVGADSSSNVWIVGLVGSSNFAMHNNGYYWDEFTMPSTSGQLRGVAVNSGDAWAGGYTGTYYGTPTPKTFVYS